MGSSRSIDLSPNRFPAPGTDYRFIDPDINRYPVVMRHTELNIRRELASAEAIHNQKFRTVQMHYKLQIVQCTT